MPFDPAALPDDIDAAMRVAAKSEIEKLSAQLARLKRAQFGRSSEKLAACVEQLELALEALEGDEAERLAAVPAMAELVEFEHDKSKPARRPLPDHLPREEIVHAGACSCPSCGGSLRRIGADVTETLDYVPGRFKVVRHVREVFSCRACESVVQTPAPHPSNRISAANRPTSGVGDAKPNRC